MDRYSSDRTMPIFAYGSRKTASGLSLLGPSVLSR